MLCAASGNDYQKDQQFRKLNKEKDSIEVKAVRGGLECLVTNTDVVVGDILLLDTGDKLVADGIAVEAFGLVIDEARPWLSAQCTELCPVAKTIGKVCCTTGSTSFRSCIASAAKLVACTRRAHATCVSIPLELM